MRFPTTDCICFRAGKVHLYSDFDGTYLPVSKKELKQKSYINLDVYCMENSELLEKTKGNLDFHISTGRNFDSFFKMMEFLKQKKIRLPLPDSLITENGSEEFIKTGNDKDFYEKDIFPFSETKTFKTKEERSSESKKLNMKYGLNKLFDVKKSITDAIKNKDIVIVAGNGSNDFDMLNPLNYVDLKKYEEKSENKEFFRAKTHKKLKDIKAVLDGVSSEYINKLRREFEKNGLIKELKELPLYCIIAKNSDKSDLKPIFEAFSSVGKTVEMERGEWSKTIKAIIKQHAKNSKEFKAGMGDVFRKYIFGKNLYHRLYVYVPAIVSITIGAACLIYRLNKKTV